MAKVASENKKNCKVFKPREQTKSCPVFYFFRILSQENNADYYYLMNVPNTSNNFKEAFVNSFPNKEIPKKIFLLAHEIEEIPNWWQTNIDYSTAYAHVCSGSKYLLATNTFSDWVSYSEVLPISYGNNFLDERWKGIFLSIANALKETIDSKLLKEKIENIYYEELRFLKYDTAIENKFKNLIMTNISDAIDCLESKK